MPGIYVHVPLCGVKCDYCDFYSEEYSGARERLYISALKREIELLSGLCKDTWFDTVYFGGGTPSRLSVSGLNEVAEALLRSFKLVCNPEISAEGNPSDFADTGKLKAFKDVGVNRLSIGIQTVCDASLKTVGRRETRKSNIKALENASGFFDNLSADVMLALPNEGIAEVSDTLKVITGCGLKHISAYALKIEEGCKLSGRIKNGERMALPDEDRAADCYDFTLDFLARLGFFRYEISNFSKPGYECLHNINYWNRGEYIGLGPSAHSFFGGKRFENPRSLKAYAVYMEKGVLPMENLSEISKKEALFERLMLGLRLTRGIDIDGVKAEFGVDIIDKYAAILKKYEKCFIVKENYLSVKGDYLYALNGILTEFIED